MGRAGVVAGLGWGGGSWRRQGRGQQVSFIMASRELSLECTKLLLMIGVPTHLYQAPNIGYVWGGVTHSFILLHLQKIKKISLDHGHELQWDRPWHNPL